MKKKQKDEMAGVQEYVSKIKALSQEKEAFTGSMEESLRSTIAQLTAENEAFIQENTKIAEFCHGVLDENGGRPAQTVQYLVQERKELTERVEKESKEKSILVKEVEEMKRGLEKSSKADLLEKQVKSRFE